MLWVKLTLNGCVYVHTLQAVTEPEGISMSDISLQPTSHLPASVRIQPFTWCHTCSLQVVTPTNKKVSMHSSTPYLRAVDCYQHSKKTQQNFVLFLKHFLHYFSCNKYVVCYFNKIPFLLNHNNVACYYNKDKFQSGCFSVLLLWAAYILLFWK